MSKGCGEAMADPTAGPVLRAGDPALSRPGVLYAERV